MKPVISINGKTYTLVKIQRGGLTAIYNNETEYLRIGNPINITKDLTFHQNMESFQFPIAKLINNGEFDSMKYFTETTLGKKKFSDLFSEDITSHGTISEEHFQQLLTLTEQYATAQLKSIQKQIDYSEFAKSLNLEKLCDELPEYQDQIKNLFEEVMTRLSVFPFVVTQGDYNAHNTFPKGVIDFTDSCYGPFGYDLIGAIVHNDYFPASQEYEYFAEYQFTPEQKQQYFSLIDTIAEKAKLPKPSAFIHDFEFCKAVWLLVGIHQWPLLQKYRYDLFVERFMKAPGVS